jgi:hypothetical protein
LVSNKVYLQIGETGYITAEARRWRRDTQRKTTNLELYLDKGKEVKKDINNRKEKEEDSTWNRKNGVSGITKPNNGSRGSRR